MYCKNCGVQMDGSQDFCLKCGVKKGNGNAFCANCGSALHPGADVCVNCGAAIKSTGSYDKVTIALLCFFLGGIGVHNFILGEKKKGIFKIIMCLCFGISYIFALIDLVKILLDKYEVNPDKLI